MHTRPSAGYKPLAPGHRHPLPSTAPSAAPSEERPDFITAGTTSLWPPLEADTVLTFVLKIAPKRMNQNSTVSSSIRIISNFPQMRDLEGLTPSSSPFYARLPPLQLIGPLSPLDVAFH